MSSIISVEGLGKKYRIQHQKEPQRYTALRDVIANKAKSIFKRDQTSKSNHSGEEDFWALKDVSFEVKEGEVLGIIGRNGAGKSTLLKILSRITEPTKGRVTLRGRVASLLEVGTGFHPELTGRENIFLNGTILGMTRAEIRSKFDEIVAFAEVEKFLDTPVKRYSSGMYVRLAFAVAAHLEPEILVVDEVLAVGDAEFQKKCLGKMKSVAETGGRTVLFVSHNTNAVEQLCSRIMLIDSGSIRMDSKNLRHVISTYIASHIRSDETAHWVNKGTEYANPWFQPLSFRLVDKLGNTASSVIHNNADLMVEIEAKVEITDPSLTMGYAIYTEDNVLLYWSYHTDGPESLWPKLRHGICKIQSEFPKRLLNEGSYRLELIGGLHVRQWLLQPGDNVPNLQVKIRGSLSDSPLWQAARPGLLAPVYTWK